jgi:hypothetical protein
MLSRFSPKAAEELDVILEEQDDLFTAIKDINSPLSKLEALQKMLTNSLDACKDGLDTTISLPNMLEGGFDRFPARSEFALRDAAHFMIDRQGSLDESNALITSLFKAGLKHLGLDEETPRDSINPWGLTGEGCALNRLTSFHDSMGNYAKFQDIAQKDPNRALLIIRHL